MGILELIFFLMVALIWASLAQRLEPDSIPGGIFATTIIGIAGAWAGASLETPIGLAIEGVAILPAVITSAAVIFVYTVFSRLARISGKI